MSDKPMHEFENSWDYLEQFRPDRVKRGMAHSS